ncbi:MAG: hypothetical protein ABI402_14020 [Ferruginibacter sp.]
MTLLEAQNIAQQHALMIRHPTLEFVVDVKYSREFHSCFYFDLIVKNIANHNNSIPIGGAAGIIVSKKNMQAREISFGNLSLLEENEATLEILYELLTGSNPVNDQLSLFKNKYKMESQQFLHLHREVQKNEKEIVLNMIQDLLDKQKGRLHVI